MPQALYRSIIYHRSLWGNPSSGLIPSAESVHSTEAMELPPDLDAFIILIANEAHESW